MDMFQDARETQDDENGPVKTEEQTVKFGSQLLVTPSSARPDYVKFSRTAKKVDVRRLKTNLWKGLSIDVSKEAEVKKQQSEEQETTRFSDVVSTLQDVYPKKQLADISTSFCFICLLHLANEKGLEITGTEDMEDLLVRKDWNAEVVDAS